MRNRDVGGAIIQTFERKGITTKSCPRFLCLVGVGGKLTGIESKPLSAALALIPPLPPGVSTLDEVGVGITTARAAFGCGIFQLVIQIQIFQSNLPAKLRHQHSQTSKVCHWGHDQKAKCDTNGKPGAAEADE